jgi:threonine/homoserine/homoserine lactone efflux protein
MSLSQAEAFLLFALLAAVSRPGPNNTLILATGSTVVLSGSLPCVFGAALGMSALLFCMRIGPGQLIIAQPTILRLLNRGGAAFPPFCCLEDR